MFLHFQIFNFLDSTHEIDESRKSIIDGVHKWSIYFHWQGRNIVNYRNDCWNENDLVQLHQFRNKQDN